MSLLLPFNCLTTYIRLRRSERGPAEPMTIILLALILIGSIIINLIVDDHSIGSETGLFTIGYEVISLIAIFGFSTFSPAFKKNQDPGEGNQDGALNCIRDYRASFMLSILLISVFPATGIICFGIQAEKFQVKKTGAPVCSSSHGTKT